MILEKNVQTGFKIGIILKVLYFNELSRLYIFFSTIFIFFVVETRWLGYTFHIRSVKKQPHPDYNDSDPRESSGK